MDNYKTIKNSTEGEYKEKGSKFIAYAFEINSEQEFKAVLEDIKKQHFKARHHCYAYAIGPEHEKYRYNDDGEPSGTAGLPIYNQIKSFGLTNIAIIVVRYFGGTKLGVPGLIRAYKTATKEALENATIITKYINDRVSIEYDYNMTGDIMKVINNSEANIVETIFDNNPQLIVEIRSSKTNEFIKNIYASLLNRNISDIKGDEHIEGMEINIL